jgi:hypothetical protein
VRETEHFINEGRGWECKRCRAAGAGSSGEEAREDSAPSHALARFFREGEAEEREPHLSSPALARWRDESRGALACARCGVEEELKG